MENVTVSGFKFSIKEEALNDWEMMELLDEMDTEPQRIVKVAKLLLGDELYHKLKEHCTENGRVKTDKMMQEIFEIFELNKNVKN